METLFFSRILHTDVGEIRIFSRDEKKQDDMRNRLRSTKLKFYIGDVRNANSISDAMRGVDYLFYAAALEQVPSCEFYPIEAVATNVLGTENTLNAAIAKGVRKVVGTEHRQSGSSHQRDGNVEGADGKGRDREVTRPGSG